jgi:hypothetical protein
MNDDLAAMVENPEYQQTIQKLLQVPPAFRALANITPVDEAYMNDILKKRMELKKLGDARGLNRVELAQKKDLAGKELEVNKRAYNLKLQGMENANELNKLQSNIGNVLGVANVGASLYGANRNYGLQEEFLKRKYK